MSTDNKFQVPEKYRVRAGRMASDARYGNNGAFALPATVTGGITINCIASDQMGWEHVSVTVGGGHRCPTWEEMARVKALFWSDDVAVAEFHPPQVQHVNYHPHCLHLWREVGREFTLPPSWMVGPLAQRGFGHVGTLLSAAALVICGLLLWPQAQVAVEAFSKLAAALAGK